MSYTLITGATGGLGIALATLLASKGIPLLLTARDSNKLRELAEKLEMQTKVDYIAANLAEDVGPVLLAIEEKVPTIVINNAGLGFYGLITDVDSSAVTIDVNVKALVQITQKAAQVWRANQCTGTVLNIASAAAYFSMPYFATYCASKAFVRVFSEAADEELSKYGIRILVSCPGQIDTPFAKHASQGAFQGHNKGAISAEKAATLLWRQIEKKQRCIVIDFRYRLAVRIAACFPRKWVQRSLAATILRRILKRDAA